MGLVVFTSKDLLTLVETVIARTGLTPTEMGIKLLRDPCFVFTLRRGRSPRLETCLRVIKECEALIEKSKYRRKRSAKQRKKPAVVGA